MSASKERWRISFVARNYPQDLDIEQWRELVPDEIRWIYGAIAVWGLEPHEIWFLDTSRLSEDCGEIVVRLPGEKARTVECCPHIWYKQWRLWEVDRTILLERRWRSSGDKTLKQLGNAISQKFARCDFPWNPLLLAKAYKARDEQFPHFLEDTDAMETVDLTLAQGSSFFSSSRL